MSTLPPLSSNGSDFEYHIHPRKRTETTRKTAMVSEKEVNEGIQGAECHRKRETPSNTAGHTSHGQTDLPLISASRLDDNLCLLQTCDGSKLDMSGDIGTIGVAAVNSDQVLSLDLKGYVYNGLPYVCNTACVMSLGKKYATITSLHNLVIYLSLGTDVTKSEEKPKNT